MASALVLLACLAMLAYQYIQAVRDRADLREDVATAFEDSACVHLTQLRVTELPAKPDMYGHRCFWVIALRRDARESGRPSHITAAEIRAWPVFAPLPPLSAMLSSLSLPLPLLGVLYGLGLTIECAARRWRRSS